MGPTFLFSTSPRPPSKSFGNVKKIVPLQKGRLERPPSGGEGASPSLSAMRSVRSTTPVWRSGGKGILSASVVLLLATASLSCRRSVAEENLPSPSSGFAKEVVALLQSLPFAEPVRIQGQIRAGEELMMLKVGPVASPDKDSPDGSADQRVIVYSFSGECCMKDGKPCTDPAGVTSCWSVGCVQEAVQGCYSKYPKGCVAIDFAAKVANPGPGLEAWWQVLRGFPLHRNDRELVVQLQRTEKGWQPVELRLIPYSPHFISLPLVRGEPCSGEFEGVFFYSTRSPEEEERLWSEEGTSERLLPPPAAVAGEVTTVRALVQALTEKIPPQEKVVYVTLSSLCGK